MFKPCCCSFFLVMTLLFLQFIHLFFCLLLWLNFLLPSCHLNYFFWKTAKVQGHINVKNCQQIYFVKCVVSILLTNFWLIKNLPIILHVYTRRVHFSFRYVRRCDIDTCIPREKVPKLFAKETLIRCHILWHLNRFCTVCQKFQNILLGYYALPKK